MTVIDVTPLAAAPTKIDSKLTNHSATVNHCSYCASSPSADLLSSLAATRDATLAIRQLHAATAVFLATVPMTLPGDTSDLARQSRALQLQLRALESDIRRGVALLQASQQAHPRCAVCTRVAGPSHEVSALKREPNGIASVCDECYRDLMVRGWSAARLVRHWLEDEQRERRE